MRETPVIFLLSSLDIKIIFPIDRILMFLLSIADFVIGNSILWGTESRYEEYYFTPRFSGDLGGI